MPKQYKVLGETRVIQDENGNAKVQISKELADDKPMLVTFLGMNVEVVANKFNMTVDDLLKLIKQNIEVEPMQFDQSTIHRNRRKRGMNVSILDKINNLSFDLQHDDELTKEQWDKVEQIYKLSLPVQLNKMQQQLLDDLKYVYSWQHSHTWDLFYYLVDKNTSMFDEETINNFMSMSEEESLAVQIIFSQWVLSPKE